MVKLICKFIILIGALKLSLRMGIYFGVLMHQFPEDIEIFKSQAVDFINALTKDISGFFRKLNFKKIKNLERFEFTLLYYDSLLELIDEINERTA